MKRKTLNCFAGIFMFTAAAFFSITSIIRPLAVSADTIITNAPTTGTLTITKRNMTQTAVKGAKYTAYKIMSLTPGKNPGEYAAYAITDAYKEALGGAAPVTPDSLGNYSAAQIESLLPKLENAATKDTAKKESAATNDSGSTVFTLETGWYLIMETETPVGAVASLPFLVAVPSTNNITSPGGTAITGTEWDYSIEASPKSSVISVDKNIINGQGMKDSPFVTNTQFYTGKHDTAAVGDIIKYKITASVPEYADAFFLTDAPPRFDFSDTLSKGLTLLTGDGHTVKIYIGDEPPTEANIIPQISKDGKTNFTLTAENQTEDANKDFVLSFTADFLKDSRYRGQKLSVEYEAQLNANAVMGSKGNTNNVIMTYNHKPSDITHVSPVPDKPDEINPDTRVYTYGIIVDKFAEAQKSQTAEALSGAKFKLYKDSAFKEAVKGEDGLDVQETKDGVLSFPRIDAGTYYLKEVASPKGYSLLTNPIKVEIIPAKDTTGKITAYGFTLKVNDKEITAADGNHMTKISADGGTATIAIENHRGFTLPATGGSGILFTVSVSAAGILAVTFYMLKSKKKED